MRVRLVVDRPAWEALVDALPRGNILQSYEWGEFKAAFGWQPLRLVVEREGRPVAGAQMLLRGCPLGTVAYVPRGPMLDFDDRQATDILLAALHREARRRGAFFLKIEPDYPSSDTLAGELATRGFRPAAAVQPHSTIVVDLAAEPAVLEGRLSRRTRYNIRLAERKGLRCVPGGEADVGEFYRLLVETARRGRFFVHPPEYYRDLWRRFAPRRMAHLMLVRHGEDALAATMFFTEGKRAYQFYGGSSLQGRRLKPNDLLQWRALLRARELGCRTYDLWGIPDEVGRLQEEAQSPQQAPHLYDERAAAGTMRGVYLFKRGFGGAVVRTVGAFDYVYAPVRYWLWTRALPATRRLVGLAAARTGGVERERNGPKPREVYEA